MKLLMILLICLTATNFLSGIEYKDFDKKSNWEKWVYFQTALNEAKRFKIAYQTQRDISKNLFLETEKRDKEILKNFKPNWGFSINASGNLDSNLNGTITINNSYQIYFFKRFYISPGVSFSLGKNLLTNNQVFGGGISFGFGVIFE